MPEPHLNRMAALLFATSYLQYCSYSNKLRLPLVELQRRQNIDPYLAYVHAMYDSARNFTGFFTAAALPEFAQVGARSYYHDEMAAMDAAYDAFVELHTRPDDYLVASLAIEERHRGAKPVQGNAGRNRTPGAPAAQRPRSPHGVGTQRRHADLPGQGLYQLRHFRLRLGPVFRPPALHGIRPGERMIDTIGKDDIGQRNRSTVAHRQWCG
ncbi:hypothetical protein LP420_23345 [Massilia sp. B-10]|nr:hypothetical protein LP420_23345 [Massilia sp. B-10]